ncbi:hypothetical protein QAD02_021634 [Eretmocerus hayati]|uniref:Uncharacterized protein n=1 Tax=Eretmocerus hayati TaxID=131215 RepID=A0ACC2PSN3_9HYME|nr:hypothetical protein QAD02_021634 [Eretmocerus hayati]
MFFDDANRSEVVNRVAIGGHIITNDIKAFASDGPHNAVVRQVVQAIPGDTATMLTVTAVSKWVDHGTCGRYHVLEESRGCWWNQGTEELTPELRGNFENPHSYATRRTEQMTGRETREVPDDKVQRVMRDCIKKLEVQAKTKLTEKQERSHNIVPYFEFVIKR